MDGPPAATHSSLLQKRASPNGPISVTRSFSVARFEALVNLLTGARHRRAVLLWPQLAEILEPYIGRWKRDSGLLFPAPRGGMLTDLSGSIRATVKATGIDKHVTRHTFRHTYAATRMQTLDNGQSVSPYTVMRELGHRSLKLIEETYGHLQQVRHRSPVVEYREADVTPIRARKRA